MSSASVDDEAADQDLDAFLTAPPRILTCCLRCCSARPAFRFC